MCVGCACVYVCVSERVTETDTDRDKDGDRDRDRARDKDRHWTFPGCMESLYLFYFTSLTSDASVNPPQAIAVL